MMKRIKIFFSFIFLFLVPISFFLLLPYSVQAFSYWDVGETLGLGEADLQETVIAIIQWILGLLGLIAVIVILYGGFIWLTSAGNEEKIAKAKKIITAAVVGLAIIILAWAISLYAINVLLTLSEAGGDEVFGPPPP